MIQRYTGGLNMTVESMGMWIPCIFGPSPLLLIFARADTSVWKSGRKGLHNYLTPSALDGYVPQQEAESVQLMHDILTSPEVGYLCIPRPSACFHT